MTSKLKKSLTIISVYLGAGFLAYILAPLGGIMHSNLLNVRCGGGFGALSPIDTECAINGFIYLFIYLLAVFSFSALRQKIAWKVYITGTFLLWLIIVYIIFDSGSYERKEYIGTLIIMFCAFGLGYLSAVGIKKVIKKMKQ